MNVMGLVGLLASERDSAVRALRREEETSKRLRQEMREREVLQEKACKSLKEASDMNIAQLEQDIGWKMKSLQAAAKTQEAATKLKEKASQLGQYVRQVVATCAVK